MKIVEVPIKKIKAGNRFREDLGDIDDLAESIGDKGLFQPITVTSKFRLVAGGRRLAAMRQLKWKNIPCIVRKTDDELDLREVELLENLMRKDMEWHEQVELEACIYELRHEQDPNWSVRDTADLIGRSKSNVHRNIELNKLLKVAPELKNEKNRAHALKKVSKLTKDYQLREMATAAEEHKGVAKWAANHYIIGDALEGVRGLADSACDFAEVDPPYAIALDEIRAKVKHRHELDRYSEISREDYPLFIETLSVAVFKALRFNTHCVWWFAWEWYHVVSEALQGAGFHVNKVPGIWYKGPIGQTNAPEAILANSYETFFLARKGRPKILKPGRSNVFEFSPIPAAHKTHATERPIEMMEEMMDTFVYPGSICLVPFLGSGVTLRAAYRKGNRGFGYDLDEDVKNHFLASIARDQKEGLIDVK